ncbi:hypothetical protein BUALT_Bualt14G0110000 [Buddleja alternifolia]|uniref:Uncharacterized protein n=1 Tax=Buddleja alternifolia TaxID=168488 RepID=A0AAV6WNA2_9LAMI|nr:hypothetical protein BUALT_Bualt14G0110000 [Buddleja alternifolia]
MRVHLYRFNEFGEDGGPAAKQWAPKLALVKNYIDETIGKFDFHVDARTFVAVCISLKGIGGLLFVIGSGFGAFLLIFYLILTTPLLYGFYNYNSGEQEFWRLLHEFLQCVALVGALLFFFGMKNSITRKQPKRMTSKPKTA